MLLLLPCRYTRFSVADRSLAVPDHCLAVVRGVRVGLPCVPCLLRYLYRAGTYREANLSTFEQRQTTPQEGRAWGNAERCCSSGFVPVYSPAAATTSALLLRPLSQALSACQSIWRDVWDSIFAQRLE